MDPLVDGRTWRLRRGAAAVAMAIGGGGDGGNGGSSVGGGGKAAVDGSVDEVLVSASRRHAAVLTPREECVDRLRKFVPFP